MLKPTKTNQQRWVRRHLNGGSYPDDAWDYEEEAYWKERRYSLHNHACFDAMEWLDRQDIQSLEEAWDRCPYTGWLDWMFSLMEPTPEEQQQWDNLYWRYQPGALRRRVRNPWVLENWRKGFFREDEEIE